MSSSIKNLPTILCLFSGGIDSTGALHVLLTSDQYMDYDLIVHHVHIQNRENRAQAEAVAVERILNYYKNELGKVFTFTQSTFNTMGFAPMKSNQFPFDMDVCTFMAANITVAHGNIQIIVRGRTKTDLESATASYQHRTNRTQAILDGVLMLDDVKKPTYEFPVIDYTKEEVWNMLPEPVRNSTWWCRRPVYKDEVPQTCGKCITCKEVSEFLT